MTASFLDLGTSLGVNARSSVQNQAAARAFIDFIARPKQNALYAETQGSLTQYKFLKGQIPAFMSDFATEAAFKQHHYVINPAMTWWNANVSSSRCSSTQSGSSRDRARSTTS